MQRFFSTSTICYNSLWRRRAVGGIFAAAGVPVAAQIADSGERRSEISLEKMDEGGEEDMPRDGKIVKELLKSMNIGDYEPQVIHQFLELWYRYVADVLTDAQMYSEHAEKSVIDSDDIKLAIQSKVDFSFSQPPPREVLLELARSRNKVPLPKSIAGPGISLPPEQDILINLNYQLAVPKRQRSEETEDEEEPNPSQNPSRDQSGLPRDTPHRVSFQLENLTPTAGPTHARQFHHLLKM